MSATFQYHNFLYDVPHVHVCVSYIEINLLDTSSREHCSWLQLHTIKSITLLVRSDTIDDQISLSAITLIFHSKEDLLNQ